MSIVAVSLTGFFSPQAKLGVEWVDVCDFTVEGMAPINQKIANHFTAVHPNSHMRVRVLAARALPDRGRALLFNVTLTLRGWDGQAATTLSIAVKSPAHMLELLRGHFGIELPEGTRLECEGVQWP